MLVGVAMLVAITQPYKPEIATYNTVDSVLIVALTMWCSTVMFISTAAAAKVHNLLETLSILIGSSYHRSIYCANDKLELKFAHAF